MCDLGQAIWLMWDCFHIWASLVAHLGKNLPSMWETWVWSLGWEDPLEKGKATHYSIPAWRIPWTLQSIDWVTKSQTRLSDFHSLILWSIAFHLDQMTSIINSIHFVKIKSLVHIWKWSDSHEYIVSLSSMNTQICKHSLYISVIRCFK